MGEAHKVGPDLTYIGLTAGERVPDMSAEDYIRQSIMEPNAYLAPECPNTPCLPGIMPQNFHLRLTDQQLEMLVSFLMNQRGPGPAPEQIGSGQPASPAPKAVSAGKVATPPPATVLPSTTIGILIILLVAAISLFLVWKNRT